MGRLLWGSLRALFLTMGVMMLVKSGAAEGAMQLGLTVVGASLLGLFVAALESRGDSEGVERG
jgi:hypothetical protein